MSEINERIMGVRMRISFLLFFGIFILGHLQLQAQEEDKVSYSYKKGEVYVNLDRQADSTSLENLLQSIGSSLAITDSLAQLKSNKVTASGWRLMTYNKSKIVYKKTLNKLESKAKQEFFFTDDGKKKAVFNATADAVYGRNNFHRPSVVETAPGVFTFQLSGFPKAEKVYLSGTFNNWSTTLSQMEKLEDGWSIAMPLSAGKYLYKFIVDGKWMIDPDNSQQETDEWGHTNSVFYVYNHSFFIKRFEEAKQVFLAGSFNDWRTDELQMQKAETGWELPLFLREGVHEYKFLVDGTWMTDPANANNRTNKQGEANSIIQMGDAHVFRLPGFLNAKKVFLAGDFNGWNDSSLRMQKDGEGWTYAHILGTGNYQYKFIVDGQWMPDPNNPHSIGQGGFENSVLSINPIHTFRLEGFESAEKVLLSGTFNGWSEDGYTMKQKEGQWEISIYLPKGKTRYKFLVDGKWMIDPQNPYWERNRYRTKDSILWVD